MPVGLNLYQNFPKSCKKTFSCLGGELTSEDNSWEAEGGSPSEVSTMNFSLGDRRVSTHRRELWPFWILEILDLPSKWLLTPQKRQETCHHHHKVVTHYLPPPPRVRAGVGVRKGSRVWVRKGVRVSWVLTLTLPIPNIPKPNPIPHPDPNPNPGPNPVPNPDLTQNLTPHQCVAPLDLPFLSLPFLGFGCHSRGGG